ncbi:4Fe-4S dicluster domain-containing protein [Terrabacter sp. Ter38]|uniref:4Fe-4S dicluster domain-containing protein n=1 Tax=Terrabacter sp. Ter38 TaxID=2926030 RepID=UPI0021196F5B|nr:4Fe-4S dicluster domain-containing protein [Terrabacter sp. Ter38]
MGFWRNQLSGPTDPAADAAWDTHEPRKGFFTDTSICIGCKACEVACKEWNGIPEDGLDLLNQSYDNTGALGASTWRHVAFVEQTSDRIEQARESGRKLVSLGMPSVRSHDETALAGGGAAATATLTPPGELLPGAAAGPGPTDTPVPDVRWLMASDVCKHCTHAACLDVCPTGALFRTEFGTVVVQDDVCNGCGYCVAACPFGVIERRSGHEGHEKGPQSHGISIKGSGGPGGTGGTGATGNAGGGSHQNPSSHAETNGEVKNVGIAQKCTLCYDRLGAGQTPACAQACPTTSIKFGDLDEMRATARARVAQLHELGYSEARLYGVDENDGVGGTGSTFLLLDEPEVYGLPPDPRVTTADLPDMFRKAGYAGLTMLAMAAASFVGRRK